MSVAKLFIFSTTCAEPYGSLKTPNRSTVTNQYWLQLARIANSSWSQREHTPTPWLSVENCLPSQVAGEALRKEAVCEVGQDHCDVILKTSSVLQLCLRDIIRDCLSQHQELRIPHSALGAGGGDGGGPRRHAPGQTGQ